MNRRRVLWDTLRWVDGLREGVQEGEPLGSAWQRAYRGLGRPRRELLWCLRPAGRGRGARGRLEVAGATFPLAEYRPWFGVLETLYSQGGSLAPTLRAWSDALERDWGREWERYARTTPVIVNLLMLLFFFPAAALLLFFPLLASFL